jgi:hypothetical protein
VGHLIFGISPFPLADQAACLTVYPTIEIHRKQIIDKHSLEKENNGKRDQI